MTVFTAADGIVAGPVDVSVLVQDRADGAPILDGRVTLERLASVRRPAVR